MNKQIISSSYLIIAAIIWGLAFVAQTTGMDYLGPFGFSMARSIIAGIFMFFLTLLIPKFISANEEIEDGFINPKSNLKVGIICGLILFLAMNAQQVGLKYTTPGKAGFITALYIVIIPIIRTFMGKKLSFKLVICVLLAMFGMYLLSVKESFVIEFGDLLVFVSAIFYSVHTLILSHYSMKVDSLKLNMYQFLICGVLSGITALILKEDMSFKYMQLSMISILYVGILSGGFAYTLQIIALKHLDPTIVALINSLEAIFATLGGFLILGQVLNTRELIGCAIMLVAIVAAQLPSRKEIKND